jgi:hypothetical protein
MHFDPRRILSGEQSWLRRGGIGGGRGRRPRAGAASRSCVSSAPDERNRPGGERNMSKLILAAAAALILTGASVRADEQVWDVDNWPGDIDLIPCSAWSKAADGTWVLHGSIKLGASIVNDVGVKGDAAARKLDRECGGTKK